MTPDDIKRLAESLDEVECADSIDNAVVRRVAAELRTLAEKGKAGGVPSDVIEAAARYGWQHASWAWESVRGGLDRFVTPPAHSPDAGNMVSAAVAVIQRWDSPLWRQEVATAELIKDLRDAVAVFAPQPKDAT